MMTTYRHVALAAGLVIVTTSMGTGTQSTSIREAFTGTQQMQAQEVRVLTYRYSYDGYGQELIYSTKFHKATRKNFRWFHVHTIERVRFDDVTRVTHSTDMTESIRRFSKTSVSDRRRMKRKAFIQSLRRT